MVLESAGLKSRIDAWARRMRPGLAENLALCNAHVNCFGVARGASFFLVTRLWPKSRGRRTAVALPGSSTPITVRLGTSDIRVFSDIFSKQEYGWNFASPPRVIVDIGAYTGLSASFFAARYPNAIIIAVEPDEENFALLKQNTACFENVHAIRAALWVESGFVSLTDPGDGAWGFRVAESDSSGTRSTEVSSGLSPKSIRAVTIDDIRREYSLDKIDLLKVDIEGSEKEIFANAESWISSVDAICIELHDRFKTGCSRSFYRAVDDFPIELRRGEDVLVARGYSRLVPIAHNLSLDSNASSFPGSYSRNLRLTRVGLPVASTVWRRIVFNDRPSSHCNVIPDLIRHTLRAFLMEASEHTGGTDAVACNC